MDVENLDALNPTELDELLERALNPRVPVEVLYAVLDRIGPAKDGAPLPVPVPATAAAPATADVEETTVMPQLAAQLQAQVHQLPQPHPHPQQPTRGAATDRAVRPERPNPKQPAPQQKGPNPNPQPSKPGQQQPKTASPAAHPSRGAHAPTRRVPSPPPTESGK
jgi:hypothetical protein